MRSRRREPTARSARPRPAKPPRTKLAVHIPSFWNASALRPATLAVSAQRPGCSARHTAVGSDGRGAVQDLRRQVRSVGGAAAKCNGQREFNVAWAEGAGLSIEEAIAYAQRGRGQRKRPANGWASLTPTELDVVRLVSDGLGNKDIATRLFVSPRTVQSHLTHVYTKLGLTSRVQLAQEAARHN
jgi:DNA-binding CsgD family transcriptional regulator